MAKRRLGGGVMYYKIKFFFETESASRCFVTCVQVFSSKNLDEVIKEIAKEKNFSSDYTVEVEKTTLKKLTEEDQRRVLSELEDEYLMLKFGADIFNSVEYAKLKFKSLRDKFAVRNSCADLLNYLCARRKVLQKVDPTKITVSEFDKMVLELINFDTNADYGNYIN